MLRGCAVYSCPPEGPLCLSGCKPAAAWSGKVGGSADIPSGFPLGVAVNQCVLGSSGSFKDSTKPEGPIVTPISLLTGGVGIESCLPATRELYDLEKVIDVWLQCSHL